MTLFLKWLSMGGYSMYVWPAYGVVVMVLFLNVLSMKWKKKQTRQIVQHWFQNQYSSSNKSDKQ